MSYEGGLIGSTGPTGPSGGPIGATGPTGQIGYTGATGLGILLAEVGLSGNLIIEYDNGNFTNAGYVIGPTGATGPAGDASTWSQYAATQTVDFGSYDIQNIAVVTAVGVSIQQIQDYNGSYGTSGQFVGSDGSGNIAWATPTGGGSTGDTGTTGDTGPTGPTGPQGANGQSSSYFNYQADNGATPTSGHISWSNFASQITSTYIRVNHLEQNGDDIDIFLNLVQQGNTLIIQDANVSANFQQWLVSGTPIPNTGSGYVQYPVTLTSSGGSTNFANNHQIILATITPGPAGPTGPTGDTGLGITATYIDGNGDLNIQYTNGNNYNLGYVIGATGPTGPTGANLLLDSGMQNRLQIVPTLSGQTSSTVSYTGPTGVGSPSSWVPFAAEAQPLTGGTLSGWRNFKEVGTTGTSTKVEWFPYNPYYGASLPYTGLPAPIILKKDLQSVWAIVTTKNRINTQGQIFFNIFTYDVANPPTTPLNTFTNRFDYSIGNYPTMYGAPVTTNQTLNGGFRYLICAVDSPKIVQQTTANRTVTLLLNQLVSGNTYTIATVGTGVNWTAMGAAVATVGCVFVYNGVAATGTLGVATEEVNTTILIGNGQTPTQTTFLKDPYDIYTTIPHVQFNAVQVASNTPQPADISNVAVSGICISSNSGAVTPTLDWTVEKIGFSANNGAVNYSYTLNY